jgi:hypothetical protein
MATAMEHEIEWPGAPSTACIPIIAPESLELTGESQSDNTGALRLSGDSPGLRDESRSYTDENQTHSRECQTLKDENLRYSGVSPRLTDEYRRLKVDALSEKVECLRLSGEYKTLNSEKGAAADENIDLSLLLCVRQPH